MKCLERTGRVEMLIQSVGRQAVDDSDTTVRAAMSGARVTYLYSDGELRSVAGAGCPR